jgi:hypothetical protein
VGSVPGNTTTIYFLTPGQGSSPRSAPGALRDQHDATPEDGEVHDRTGDRDEPGKNMSDLS